MRWNYIFIKTQGHGARGMLKPALYVMLLEVLLRDFLKTCNPELIACWEHSRGRWHLSES